MSTPGEPFDPVTINRAHWDSLAEVHGNGADSYYDVAALAAGSFPMGSAERAAVGDLRGRDVVHIQCHLGFDSVLMARAGARVTGVDLSPKALAKAAEIAARCGVAIEYVQADATHLPADLHGRFDLAYATLGVLGWIGDLHAWMGSVAACLRPGGKFVLVEFHPLLGMFRSLDPVETWASYEFDGPHVEEHSGSYANAEEPARSPSRVLYRHSLGEVITAAAEAGLGIDAVIEHMDADNDMTGWLLSQGDDGRWRYRLGEFALPVLFTLRASKQQ